MNKEPEESLVRKENDPFIRFLNRVVILCVKVLAVFIVCVLLWGMIDVAVHIYNQSVASPIGRFDTDELLQTLGSFLAVLIVVEVFLNIVFYLKKDAIHVPLVLATGLTAVARKVIIIDYFTTAPLTLFGIASVILSVGLVYWLVAIKDS